MTHDLVITQHVPAPPHEVYAAWLTPEGLSRWWWVAIGDTTYAVDGRVGGAYLVESAGVGIGVRGTFTRLEEPTLIEMTWTWLEGAVAGPEERVRVDLAPRDGGTLVTLTHQVADSGGVESYRQGWDYVLGNLARLPQDGHIGESDDAKSAGGEPAGGESAGGEPAGGEPAGGKSAGGESADGGHQSITLSQVVPAPRSDTFAAWVEPERLARWWWPGQDTTYEVDARRGGRFAIRSAQTGLGATGTFLELDEGERLVMTWTWESPGGEGPADMVTVTFSDHQHPETHQAEEDAEPGTLVTLVHEFAAPQEDTSNPTRGWSAVLTSLAEDASD